MPYIIQLTHTEEGTVEYYATGVHDGSNTTTKLFDYACSFATINEAYDKINNQDSETHKFFHSPFKTVKIYEVVLASVPDSLIAELDQIAACNVYAAMSTGQRRALKEIIKQ